MTNTNATQLPLTTPALDVAFARYAAACRVQKALADKIVADLDVNPDVITAYDSRHWRAFSRACDLKNRLLVAYDELVRAAVRSGQIAGAT